MNRKPIFAALFLLVAIGAFVVVRLWMATPRQATQSIILPDGSRLSLRTVTYKAPHEIAYGLGWRDKIYQLLPASAAKKLGAKVNHQSTTHSNSVVVWFQLVSPSGPVPLGAIPAAFITSNVRATAVDENGLESAEEFVSFTPGPGFFGLELRNFPRRSRELIVRLYSNGPMGQRSKLGEFKIANHFPVTTPGWTPESLPATRETNGLTISLLSVETGRNSFNDNSRNGGEQSRRYSRAYFTLTENGQRATNWGISKMHFDSATSGPLDPGSYSSSWARDRFTFHFEGALWPEEPAWKLTAEAWRLTDFPAEELWVVANISVPEPREVTEVNAKTNKFGAPVELLGIITSGAATPKGWDASMSMGGAATLHVTMGVHPADVHLTLVEARDDRGRKVEIQGSGYSGDSTNKMHHAFGLKFPDGAKTIDVTLAISKSRNVTFLVKPTFTNAPPATNR